MNDKRNSVKISGAGTIGGGTYDRVSISGAGKITGDLIAEELKISGVGKIQGRAQVTQIVTSGSANFTDSIVAEEMRVSGSARVDGPGRGKGTQVLGNLQGRSWHSFRVRKGERGPARWS